MSGLTVIGHTEVSSSGAADITFSSISGNFTDLLLLFGVRGSNNNVSLRFNGSQSGYTSRLIRSSGSGAPSTFLQSGDQMYWMAAIVQNTANTFSNGMIYIPNYTSNTNKMVIAESVSENNETLSYQETTAGIWANTNAITSVSIFFEQGGASFTQFTSATLYGITKGSSGGVTVS